MKKKTLPYIILWRLQRVLKKVHLPIQFQELTWKITPWFTSKSLILGKIIPLAFATEHSTESPLWAVFYALAESH